MSILYAAMLALAWLSFDQLSEYMPGAWFELLGASVLVLSLLTLTLALRHAWRRHQEGLDRQGLAWASGALVPIFFAGLAVYGLVQNAQIASVISGADVHLTKPLIDSLPQPPGTKLLDETPGLADTESISEDFSAKNLNAIVPFYEGELAKLGWTEDKTSAGTPIVRFTKGEFVLSVAIDPPSGDYTLTVDRISTTPSAAASASAS